MDVQMPPLHDTHFSIENTVQRLNMDITKQPITWQCKNCNTFMPTNIAFHTREMYKQPTSIL